MMKILNKTLILTASALVFSLSVSAHDPSMHKKKAEKADCTTFNEMQESGKKMDMNDPTMMAMMKKCKKSQHDNNDGHHDNDNAENKDENKAKGDKKCGDMKKSNSKTEEHNDNDH